MNRGELLFTSAFALCIETLLGTLGLSGKHGAKNPQDRASGSLSYVG